MAKATGKKKDNVAAEIEVQDERQEHHGADREDEGQGEEQPGCKQQHERGDQPQFLRRERQRTPARLRGEYGPDSHLEPGDVATCWIEGIGELRNKCVAEPAAG